MLHGLQCAGDESSTFDSTPISNAPESIVRIPLALQNADQSTTYTEFVFDFLQPHSRLEFSVGAFCEAHNIRHTFCKNLYAVATERVAETKEQYYRTTTAAEEKTAPAQDMSQNRTFVFETGSETSGEMIRHFASFRSYIQFQQQYLRQIAVNDVVPRETFAVNLLNRRLDSLRKRVNIRRLVFIHSVLFVYQDTSILESLLKRLQSSGVYWESDLVCVLHYGRPLHPAFRAGYPETTFVHVSNYTSLFEIPSLRIMQQVIAHAPPEELDDTHVLYMHTLGQSYFLRYESLSDWRELMLHFLVDGYFRRNYHLLSSGVYDILGVNYERDPRRFHGNFWWATARYLSSISPFAMDLLHSNFLEIDHFIFQAPNVRVYILHNADVNHHSQRYPAFCYRSLTEAELAADASSAEVTNARRPPPFTIWSDTCHNTDKYDYLRLHQPDAIPELMYAVNNKWGVDIARCHSLDLTST